ncbi:MAG: glycosyltransferase family 9 protein, partial [bacterium]
AEKGLMKKIFEIPGTVDLVGLGWEETIAVIKRCGLFIGSDSVMQYFSAYSGVNTAVIAGYIVEYGRWKPKVDSGKLEIFRIPVHCGPCESNVCVNEKEGHICMTGITPEMVYERIKKWV